MRFDDLLQAYLGEFGKYQRIQFFLVCLPCIIVSMQVLSWTFTGAVIPSRCLLPDENETSHHDYGWICDDESDDKRPEDKRCYLQKAPQFNVSKDDFKKNLRCDTACTKDKGVGWCNLTLLNKRWPEQVDSITCRGYVWDNSEITNTAVTRWTIVCDRKWILSVVQSMYYVGQFLGSLLFGYLADRFGRKICFFVAILLQAVVGTTMAFVPWWQAFAFLRILAGICHPGIFVISVVLGMELVGPSKRMMGGIITGLFFAIGQIILGLLAFAIRDYQHLQLAISLPAVVFICYWWVIPESARWLVSQRRYPEADRILRRAAKMNGNQLPANWWDQLDDMKAPEKFDDEHVGDEPAVVLPKEPLRKYNYFDLFRTPQIRFRILISWICWPTVSMVYYGISMNPSFAGGDRYGMFIASGLAEVPGILIALVFVNRLGRKALLVCGFCIAGVGMLLTAAIPEHLKVLVLVCVIVSKSAITMCYAVIYVFTPEIFPTVIRSLAMGTCSMVARVGAVGASFLGLWLVDISKLAVVMIFGVFAMVSAALTMFLPETSGQPMIESIDEAERFGRNQRMCTFRVSREESTDVGGVVSPEETERLRSSSLKRSEEMEELRQRPVSTSSETKPVA